jgi:hypothetical protein
MKMNKKWKTIINEIQKKEVLPFNFCWDNGELLFFFSVKENSSAFASGTSSSGFCAGYGGS